MTKLADESAHAQDNRTVSVPARSLPITDECDVLVVGSGSAGVAAALAAARNRAKTILVDSAAKLGGTAGCLGMFSKFHDNAGARIVGGIIHEIALELLSQGGLGVGQQPRCDFAERVNWISYDVEKYLMIIHEKLHQAGVRPQLHTQVTQVLTHSNRCIGAVLHTKAAARAINAKVIIDCTGDADVLQVAGVEIRYGREKDGKAQPASTIFTVGNVDQSQFTAGYPQIPCLWDQFRKSHDVINPREGSALSGPWGTPGRPGEVTFNYTRVFNVDPADPDNLVQSEVIGRRQVREMLQFLRSEIPGFQNAYLLSCAPLGIRESRRMVGDYILTADDLNTHRRFPDSIACNSYPIDIHSPNGSSTYFPEQEFIAGQYYTIPYRCLVPRNIDCLLGAGRLISATHEALAAVRVMTCTMATGQAAGTAAALAAAEDICPRHLDVKLLQNTLSDQGALVQ